MSHARLVRTTDLIKPGLAVLGVLFSGLIGWTLWQSREAAHDDTMRTAARIATTFERDLGRELEGLELSLQATVRKIELPGIADLPPELQHAIVFDGATLAEGGRGIAIVNAAGDVITVQREANLPTINLSDRDYFVALRDHPELRSVISRPIQDRRNGQWSIILARRINHSDGSFAGLAAVPVRLSHLETLFQQSLSRGDFNVSLVSTNGWLVARWPLAEQLYGRDVSHAPVFRQLAISPEGFFTGESPIDHVERLYAYRQIGELPLVIIVGVSTQVIFIGWLSNAVGDMVLLGALGLVLACLGLAFRRELKLRIEGEEQAKVAARAVASSMARLDALFQNSPDAMAIVAVHQDDSFTYESVNPALQAALGLDAAAMSGKGPAECLPRGAAKDILEQWRECVRGRVPRRYALKISMPDRSFDSEVMMAPVFDEAGRVCRLIGSSRDVTERNRVEAQLRQAHKLEMVGQVAAGIAHDFNNLLQAILGAVDLLGQQAGDNQTLQHPVAIARKAAYRGASLTHRLLTVSRQQSLSPTMLDLRETVSEMTQILQLTLGPHIRIEQDFEVGLWPVMADVREVETCLVDLTNNSRDAMATGGVLRLCLRNAQALEPGAPDLPPGEYVVIGVEDTGVGMEGSTLARACDPFFTTKAPGKGSGLGLSMVNGFAAQSGGAMTLDSQVGRGTRVELWLPRASGFPSVAKHQDEPDVSGGSARVLLADDDAEVREVLGLLLADAGYIVTPTESGMAALAVIESGAALDLLVSDYAMPGMTGAELVSRALQARPQMPALIITGFDAIGADQPLPSGVRLLRKPIRRHDLLVQVEAALAGRPGARPNEVAPASSDAGNVVQFASRQRAPAIF